MAATLFDYKKMFLWSCASFSTDRSQQLGEKEQKVWTLPFLAFSDNWSWRVKCSSSFRNICSFRSCFNFRISNSVCFMIAWNIGCIYHEKKNKNKNMQAREMYTDKVEFRFVFVYKNQWNYSYRNATLFMRYLFSNAFSDVSMF